jgi:hypothetical protein
MSRLPDLPHPVEELAAASGVRDLETAIALTTHQCAALAAGVQAAVAEAVAELNAAVEAAEQRIERAAARAVARIEQAAARP